MCSRVFGQAREIVHLGAWRSIETLLGESDLLWLVKADGAKGRIHQTKLGISWRSAFIEPD